MSDLPRLPFERHSPLDIAPMYTELQAKAPISRVRTPAGDVAWLVSGYEEAKKLFADPRLGRSHPEPDRAPRISGSVLTGGPLGDHDTEHDYHTRMRRLLVPAFSARRMKALSGHVAELVDGLLTRMATLTPPVDLHEKLSFPLPAMVLCELLGVPFDDRAHFRALADGMADMSDPARSRKAQAEMLEYTGGLLAAKRAHPTEDVFSDLAAGDFTVEEAALLAAGLLFAGHETTVNRIDYGVLFLLTDPAQRDALVADPTRAPALVEEILRMAAPGQLGLSRYAHDDIEIGGVTIRRGEAVVIYSSAANRDARTFHDPNRFDMDRESPEPHIAFGYAAHYCIGAGLARVELQAVFGTLFQRFPTLTLATPLDRLTERTDRISGGLTELPVTW
ncbi:MAG TPA: cytochrome P450 [Thermopolyspora sp.]|jgi:Cytochrome P450